MQELMSTRIPKLITYSISDLYGISKKCDIFIHTNKILNITNKINPKFIFISSYKGNITIPFFINNILKFLKQPIILIIASEDFTFPTGNKDARINHYKNIQKDVYYMINHRIIEKIYVENLDILHPKLHPLPLGMHPIYDPNYLKLYIDLLPTINIPNYRPIEIFCNCKIRKGPQWKDRLTVKKLCQMEWKSFVTWKDEISDIEFKNTLLQSKFVICVHGGGIDPAPRVWEALLCGCIPIIEHSTLDAAYSRFPVIFVNKWNSNVITKEKIALWNEEYVKIQNDSTRRSILEKLSLNYWWNEISK